MACTLRDALKDRLRGSWNLIWKFPSGFGFALTFHVKRTKFTLRFVPRGFLESCKGSSTQIPECWQLIQGASEGFGDLSGSVLGLPRTELLLMIGSTVPLLARLDGRIQGRFLPPL